MGNLFSCTCSEPSDERATPYSLSEPESLPLENSIQKASSDPYAEYWDLPTLLTGMTRNIPIGFARTLVRLIQEGNTLPFLKRYRERDINYLSSERLQEIFDCYQMAFELRRKGISLLKSLEKSQKLTPDIKEAIIKTRSSVDLDLILQQLKDMEVSSADHARALGLYPVAVQAMNKKDFKPSSFISHHLELNTREKLEQQLSYIISEIIYRDDRVLCYIRKLISETNFTITSCQNRTASETFAESEDNIEKKEACKKYYNFESTSNSIESLDMLAINRGMKEDMLSVKVIVPFNFLHKLESFCNNIWVERMVVSKGIYDGFHRIIIPWLSQQVIKDLTNKAEKESVENFAENLERLLLTEPLKNKIILGIDPGNHTCKIGIINSKGKKLATRIIHPFKQQGRAKSELLKIISLHEVVVIALGNGQGSCETEKWLKTCVSTPVLAGVPEIGASSYSITDQASKDDPNLDPVLLSALSIARRVLDPLAEYAKMGPANLGIGIYQHDINPKTMADAFDSVVRKVISLVGADLNTASYALLSRISGLNASKAAAIIEYREYRSFRCRTDLLKVPGIDQATYKQCVGFLRISEGINPLDNTFIHPESYDVTNKFLKLLSIPVTKIFLNDKNDLKEIGTLMAAVDITAASEQLRTDEATLTHIVNVCKQQYEVDTRYIKPVYISPIQNITEIKTGSIIEGVVRNVTPAGCFVDCGLEYNGLIRSSTVKGKNPKVLQHVSVRVLKSPTPKRLPLQLVKILS